MSINNKFKDEIKEFLEDYRAKANRKEEIMNKMFCYQCEQTAGCRGCLNQGVCGKKAETANLQDELTSKTIEFANCASFNEENTNLIIESLFTTITNVNFDDKSIKQLIQELINKTPCNNNFDIKLTISGGKTCYEA